MSLSVQRKIVDITSLVSIRQRLRADGHTLVQCHGCFDIVHPGHVRYLQFARRLGDRLLVSLTGDALVNKGADRPYIPQNLRAENLAALEFVDWVVIDPHPTAAELLAAIQPDVYVKGREYAASSDPRFAEERRIVEQYGGRVIFHSGDVVFSSTRLIESLDRDGPLDECRLRALCATHGLTYHAARAALERWQGLPVLVVGDVIREEYVLCDAREAAVNAPALSLEELARRRFWGGAAALAMQLHALGARPHLISTVGPDTTATELTSDLEQLGLPADLLEAREGIVTRRTFVADDTKLYHVSAGAYGPLDSLCEQRVAEAISRYLGNARLLVWCEQGCGTITPALVRQAAAHARESGIPIAGMSGGPRGDLSLLRETDLLAVREKRLRTAANDLGSGLPALAWRWLEQTAGQSMLVALHKRGLIGFDGRPTAGESEHLSPQRLRSAFVPSFAAHFVDMLGAEEAALSVAAASLATETTLPVATYLAAAAEALVVTRPGRSRCTRDQLLAWIDSRPELRPESEFLPDAATLGDIARLAPPLSADPAITHATGGAGE